MERPSSDPPFGPLRGRRSWAAVLAATGLGFALRANAQDLPTDQHSGGIEAAAAAEGRVIVRTTTDHEEAAEMLAGFSQLYPDVAVDYVKMNSVNLYEDFLADQQRGGGTADVLWSSAMHQQIKLVNDGYAARIQSAHSASLPPWAVWRNEAYGISAEPVGLAYNRRLLPDADAPRTHERLAEMIEADRKGWAGRIATYDPENSETGYLLLAHDVRTTQRTWDLVRAMSRAGARLYTSTSIMLDRVALGEQTLAYNVLGPYALERAKATPALGVIFPDDYTLVVSRIAFVSRAARNPNAGRLFLDYMLSRDGQTRLAAHSIGSVRTDMSPGSFLTDGPMWRPIPVGPGLLAELDHSVRAGFLKQWRRALLTR